MWVNEKKNVYKLHRMCPAGAVREKKNRFRTVYIYAIAKRHNIIGISMDKEKKC